MSREPVVLAIDAGTGSARALAVALDGTVVARAGREWSHRAVAGHPGGTAFDTAANWALVAEAVREVVTALGGRPVAAVAASSMREGFVLYDGRGRELWACPNTDGRARGQAQRLVDEGAADRIFALGGDWVSITAPARLRWIAEEAPEVLAEARHFGMLSDWVVTRLTGEFTTDPTCGSSSALFDLSARSWSTELAGLVGIDPAILPPVLEGGEIAGRVTPDAADATGLPAGTPVVIGGADTQLALHGIGAVPGAPVVVGGTFWQTTALVDRPVIDPERRLRTLCHVEPGSWMVEGISFLSGLAMRWLRDVFFVDAVAARGPSGAFDVMEELAAAVPPGSNGLVAVLANAMQADAWHHAAPAFVGFDINDPERFGRGTFVRSVEEAAAWVVRAHLAILDELTAGAAGRSGELVFAGGSSGGRLWPQLIADATSRTVVTSTVAEATSYGAARLAAAAVGAELPPAGGGERRLAPEASAVAASDEAYRRWLAVYDAQVRATGAAGIDPLFTPPGGLHYRPARPTDREKKDTNG